ncbi:MAG: glycosyltransferase family 4 protein, partial [Candidatus Lokiarchaeota archaeon]
GPSTIAFNRELSKIRKIKDARIVNLSPDNLTGYLDKKKISAFKKSDIYLMPSRSDAFGIAFLEAWAAGKPVIGADIGATPEVIRNQIDGLLVRFNNKDEICEAVLKLLKNKALRKKLGQVGKEKVSRYYTWEKVVKKTVDIYSELKK